MSIIHTLCDIEMLILNLVIILFIIFYTQGN